jgi:hypothetical protein
MIAKMAAIGLSCVLLAACAEPSAPAPAPAAPPAPPPAAAPEATGPRLVNIRALTCGHLLGASDEDRAAGSMFLLGYASATTGRRVIDVNKVEGLEKFALADCVNNPDLPAVAAFSRALQSRELMY